MTLNNFAWHMTLHGRSAEAVPVAKRAIVADPSCWYCYDTLALALFRTGEFKDAVAMQEMAVAVRGERRIGGRVFVRLQAFQDAWSQIVLWKKRPQPGRDPNALPPEVALAILRAQNDTVTDCYEQTLTRAPELAGRLVVRADIGVDGKLAGVTLLPASEWGDDLKKPPVAAITEEEFTRCVLEQVGSAVFPPSSAPTKLAKPYTFTPEKPTSD